MMETEARHKEYFSEFEKKLREIYPGMLAIGAGKALSDAGYKVPEDISLTGFDGVEIGKYVIPSLTTLKQPVDSMARETARILFDIIGKKAKHQHCVFDGELVVRDSTMPRT